MLHVSQARYDLDYKRAFKNKLFYSNMMLNTLN